MLHSQTIPRPLVMARVCLEKVSCENKHKHCKDKEPSILFICKIELKKPRHLKKIDKRCRTIVMKLIDHRSAMQCDCDLEYIKTNRTKRDNMEGSAICEIRDKALLKAMARHDKICGCGAFEFIHQEKGNSTSPRAPRSSKTPNSSRAHVSTKISTPHKTPRSSKAPASSKSSTPPKTPIYNAMTMVECPKEPFDDESEYDENIFTGIPRKF